MRKFNITVNGVAYDVAVDEIGGAPSAAPAAAPANGTKVNAPMPGNILDVCVKVGDKVSNGQKLVVLEAMKMENDITSPADGTIASISVNKGDMVSTGDNLVVIG